jgi:ubiquinone/menaquinone biosynthesis C-methylase UbiE
MSKKIKGFQDTIDWYNKNAESYASNIENIPSLDLLNKFVGTVDKDGKVLDAGCAAGRDCAFFKARGLNPIGVDLSEPLLAIAIKKHPDIQFEQANFLNLPFEDELFDGVWAHASLLHLETTEEVLRVLKEFHRVLKLGGVIHVFVKQPPGKEKTSVVSDELSGHERFFQWFTKGEVKSLLEQVEFKVEEIQDEYADPANRKEVRWIVGSAKK